NWTELEPATGSPYVASTPWMSVVIVTVALAVRFESEVPESSSELPPAHAVVRAPAKAMRATAAKRRRTMRNMETSRVGVRGPDQAALVPHRRMASPSKSPRKSTAHHDHWAPAPKSVRHTYELFRAPIRS